MSDEADVAQLYEERDREVALNVALRARRTAVQLKINGVVICLGCGRAIPLARLRAVPGAARCTGCEAVHEEVRT